MDIEVDESVYSLAAAMCNSPFSMCLSTTVVRIISEVVKIFVAKRSRAFLRSAVSPRRAR